MSDLVSQPVLDAESFLPAAKGKAPVETLGCQSLWQRLTQAVMGNRVALVCLVLLVLLIVLSAFAPCFTQWDPNYADVTNKFAAPSREHLLGTDKLGRDYLSRCLHGGRVSLVVGFFAMLVSCVFGVIYGAVSGYVGGAVDAVMMRLVEVFMSVPTTLVVILIASMFNTNIVTLVLIIGGFSWMSTARIVRAETLSLKERDFILASKSLGAGNVRVIVTHILPSLLSVTVVSGTINIARAILMESTLSYLGFGVSVPTASWGGMLQDAQSMILTRPLMALYPGVMIILTVLSFHFLGDIMRKTFEAGRPE